MVIVGWLISVIEPVEVAVAHTVRKKLGEVQTRTALRKTGSIAQTHSYLLEEWDYRKNIIKPEEISIGSDRKVWWKCRFCGYEWEAPPNSSNRRTSFEKGCPACLRKTIWEGHNDLATTNPSLASEWNYERNTNITPNSITDGSNKKYGGFVLLVDLNGKRL